MSESMTRRRLALALAVSVAVCASLFAQTTKSVWSGVYTAAQATRGTDLYQRVCSECHGDDLEGREKAPALAGGSFAQRWDGATLKKLFERMQEMPPDDPAARLQPNAVRRHPRVSVEREQHSRRIATARRGQGRAGGDQLHQQRPKF